MRIGSSSHAWRQFRFIPVVQSCLLCQDGQARLAQTGPRLVGVSQDIPPQVLQRRPGAQGRRRARLCGTASAQQLGAATNAAAAVSWREMGCVDEGCETLPVMMHTRLL